MVYDSSMAFSLAVCRSPHTLHVMRAQSTDHLCAEKRSIVAVVVEDMIVPVKNIVGEDRKILEGRIEYALATTHVDQFKVYQNCIPPDIPYSHLLENRLVYHFSRAESRDAFAAWQEERNRRARNKSWLPITGAEIIAALSFEGERLFKFRNGKHEVNNRAQSYGSMALDLDMIDEIEMRAILPPGVRLVLTGGGRCTLPCTPRESAVRGRKTCKPTPSTMTQSTSTTKSQSASAAKAQPAPAAEVQAMPTATAQATSTARTAQATSMARTASAESAARAASGESLEGERRRSQRPSKPVPFRVPTTVIPHPSPKAVTTGDQASVSSAPDTVGTVGASVGESPRKRARQDLDPEVRPGGIEFVGTPPHTTAYRGRSQGSTMSCGPSRAPSRASAMSRGPSQSSTWSHALLQGYGLGGSTLPSPHSFDALRLQTESDDAHSSSRAPSLTHRPERHLLPTFPGSSIYDSSDPRGIRVCIARHWSTICDAVNMVTSSADAIERLASQETNIARRAFGAPLNDGYSEHEPVLSGHVSSTADVPNMATRVTNVVHRAMQPDEEEDEVMEIEQ